MILLRVYLFFHLFCLLSIDYSLQVLVSHAILPFVFPNVFCENNILAIMILLRVYLFFHLFCLLSIDYSLQVLVSHAILPFVFPNVFCENNILAIMILLRVYLFSHLFCLLSIDYSLQVLVSHNKYYILLKTTIGHTTNIIKTNRKSSNIQTIFLTYHLQSLVSIQTF